MPSALSPGRKIQGLSDCQLWQMIVCLVYVCGRSLGNKLLEAVPIVRDDAIHLQQAQA